MNSTITEPEPQKAAAIRFSLDGGNGIPIYRQIIQQIEYAILSERIRPGDRLPTIRSLAVELKTNPNTIAKAYGELEIRGVLETQVGSGTYVSDKASHLGDAVSAERLNRKIREVLGRFIQEMKDLGVEGDELITLVKNYGRENQTVPLPGGRGFNNEEENDK